MAGKRIALVGGGFLLSLWDPAPFLLAAPDVVSEELAPWQEAGEAKYWYMRLKSRPAFRPLIDEQIRRVRPPEPSIDSTPGSARALASA